MFIGAKYHQQYLKTYTELQKKRPQEKTSIFFFNVKGCVFILSI